MWSSTHEGLRASVLNDSDDLACEGSICVLSRVVISLFIGIVRDLLSTLHLMGFFLRLFLLNALCILSFVFLLKLHSRFTLMLNNRFRISYLNSELLRQLLSLQFSLFLSLLFLYFLLNLSLLLLFFLKLRPVLLLEQVC